MDKIVTKKVLIVRERMGEIVAVRECERGNEKVR